MPTLPFFSIILPTYNRGKFLERAIRSVIDQTFKDWELIIIDDGSTDNTRDVVAQFSDKRIQYFWQKNSERSAARNKGIEHSNGKYICFLDSDDYYLENHLDTFYNYTIQNNTNNSILYVNRYYRVNGELVKYSYKHNLNLPLASVSYITENILTEAPPIQAICIIRSLGNSIAFNEDSNSFECNEYILGLVMKGAKLVQLPNYTLVMCIHEQNSSAYNKYFIETRINFFDRIETKYKYLQLDKNKLYRLKKSLTYLALASFLLEEKKVQTPLKLLLYALCLKPNLIFNRQSLGLIRRALLNKTGI